MKDRPAIKILLPMAAGIVAARMFHLPPGPVFLVTLFFFVLTVVPAVAGRHPGSTAAVLLSLTICSFGALLLSMELHLTGPRDLRASRTADTVVIAGVVLEPRGSSRPSARFLVEARSIAGPDGAEGVGGRILLAVSGAALRAGTLSELVPGREVVLRGVLRPPSPARNPGEVDWAAYYELAGISGRMNVRSPGNIVTGGMSGRGFMNAFVLPVRKVLSDHLRSLVNDREARFLNGLILGERNEVPSDLKADFVTVGVMHLLAISGQQVVIVAMLLAAFLTIVRIPEKPRFVLVALALGYYVLLTGASPSVTRAGIMCIVLLGARVTQRRADIFNALGIAAVLILLASPRQLFDAGFLLSFSAVVAIVTLYPVIIGAFPAFTARVSRVRILDLVWKGVAVSLAAGLGTAPIVAYYFGRVSVVGFLANIIIVPLSSLALVLGMLTVAASFISTWVASVYAAGAEVSAWLTFRLVEFFAGFPYAMVNFRLSLLSVGTVYGVLYVLMDAFSKKNWKPVLLGSLVVTNIVLYSWVLSGPQREVLRITFLDVGQGDAAFLEFPGGRTMLIDGGPKTFSYDAGERVVLPFLEYKGIDHIDMIVVSHPHSDHLGGIPAVLRGVTVGEVIEGGPGAESSLYREYRTLVDSLRVPRRVLATGDRLGGGLPAGVYVLWPDTLSGVRLSGLNEQSVVLDIRYGETAALFTGDAEDGAESEIVARYGDFLRAGLLKAGHHGSITSSTPEFIAGVGPEITVISVGEGNKFGHPSGVVTGRYAEAGSIVERTDLSGALVFESDGTRWERVQWR